MVGTDPDNYSFMLSLWSHRWDCAKSLFMDFGKNENLFVFDSSPFRSLVWKSWNPMQRRICLNSFSFSCLSFFVIFQSILRLQESKIMSWYQVIFGFHLWCFSEYIWNSSGISSEGGGLIDGSDPTLSIFCRHQNPGLAVFFSGFKSISGKTRYFILFDNFISFSYVDINIFLLVAFFLKTTFSHYLRWEPPKRSGKPFFCQVIHIVQEKGFQ